MPEALQHFCHHHPAREAAARCPACRNFFCRECVTEHDDVVICTTCLRLQTGSRAARKWSLAFIPRLAAAAAGLLVAFFFFYALGRVLVVTPSAFHEGTVWKVGIWD